MRPETVYNPTTVSSRQPRGGYLDSISQGSRGHRRCCTVTIAVVATISSLLGLALVLYGSFFHYHFSGSGPASEPAAERERRLQEVQLYRALLAAGLPLLLLSAGLWVAYLHRRGRCRHCRLCPAARKRRRLTNHFQTQCLEAGNLSACYTSRPAGQLSQEEDRLVSQSLDQIAGLEDTDAMLVDSGPRPVLRPMQAAT